MGKFTLTYWRHHAQYSDEFDSAQEAAQWALDQEYEGNISWESITDSDGNSVTDGRGVGYEELRKLGAKS